MAANLKRVDANVVETERPNKRARLSLDPEDKPSTSATVNDAMNDDADEDEESSDVKADPLRPSDLYLDTINRTALDFDFEKLCSVSLSNINVYGCLVCGKYFQGRGKSSYAYAHSIHEDHHVFIQLETKQVYVLPDGYPVSDPSLEDIAFVLGPSFTSDAIKSLDTTLKPSFDLQNKEYIPGYIGLNNIKRHDHLNVIIHALLHVPPLRDFLLTKEFNSRSKDTELVRRFVGLAKKVWNPRLFKAQVSPHEFLQEVGRASGGRFSLEKQGDPAEFLGWLLNKLHVDLGGSKKRNSSIIYSIFQGELRLETQQVLVRGDKSENAKPQFEMDRDIKTTVSPFLFLAVDLPPPPLFQDVIEKNIIPQVSIYTVMAKFDGKTTQEMLGQIKRYKCQRLPRYIVLHFKRFMKNNFVEEKNPTIVNFPIHGVDFRECLDNPSSSHPSTIYDLLSNITHESVAGTTRDKENTVWKVHLKAGRGEDEKWFQIQDLIVEEVRKEMIFLGETVLQIWERRDEKGGKDGASGGVADVNGNGAATKRR
ncbi:cysteine proteinase [Sistotremastrum niveocremeum HHB9708]|uniref:Cysteine proteinase n=1 Tax=Sistotremastrum niveocremeum HHB9708 TaxID=1314777 RepID=A0A164RSV3_9AGAM|nr:cysteine proteinase [Sistotremastrum niveocremeum HHB9708]